MTVSDFFSATTIAPEHQKSLKGRGARSNATGRYERYQKVAVEDSWPQSTVHEETAATTRTQVMPMAVRTILAKNSTPNAAFSTSINPYRGCEHGCIYCFARPNHAHLGLSPGLDFERRLFAKVSAATALRRQFKGRQYKATPIVLGTNTDPYQPIEQRYRITRQLLEVFSQHNHPLTIITKGAGIVRDRDLLADLARRRLVRVFISLTTLARHTARVMEPRAASPEKRLTALRDLTDVGVPVSVMMAPIIPCITDHEIEKLLHAASQCGAVTAGYSLLRLPLEVRPLFEEWLHHTFPHKARRVMNHVASYQGPGRGLYAQMLRQRFRLAVKKNRLDSPVPQLDSTNFVKDPAALKLAI